MNRIMVWGLFFSLMPFGCRHRALPDNPEILKEVLFAYFNGIKNKDFGQMTRSTTDAFVLYEMGRVWNNDSVFKEMKKFPYSVNYTFDNFKINMDATYGHIIYYNQGDFLFDGATQHFDWIESAAFRKTNGGWKMYFLHITERVDLSKVNQTGFTTLLL